MKMEGERMVFRDMIKLDLLPEEPETDEFIRAMEVVEKGTQEEVIEDTTERQVRAGDNKLDAFVRKSEEAEQKDKQRIVRSSLRNPDSNCTTAGTDLTNKERIEALEEKVFGHGLYQGA